MNKLKRADIKSVIQLFSYILRQTFRGSFILLFTACTSHHTVIEGTVPGDQYDQEVVYWVPFEGATSKTVDSTLIHKNKFRIIISDHNLNRMGIIRLRYQLRLSLQELLVYTEAGRTVQVKIDSISSASGAPLNDVLQIWKDRKQKHNEEFSALRKKHRDAGDDEKTAIQEEMETVSAAYNDDVYRIVVENKDNEVGKFIFLLHKAKFTPEQISEIDNHSMD